MSDNPGGPDNQQSADSAKPLDAPIRHREQDGGGAFVAERNGKRVAELTYTLDRDGTAVLNHTFVSDELRGQGIALRLTKSAVEWARRSKIKVVPVCSYARAVFQKHPELTDVLRGSSA